MIDEARFHVTSYMNSQNTYHRDTENPHYLQNPITWPGSWCMVYCKG